MVVFAEDPALFLAVNAPGDPRINAPSIVECHLLEDVEVKAIELLAGERLSVNMIFETASAFELFVANRPDAFEVFRDLVAIFLVALFRDGNDCIKRKPR